MKNKEKNFFSPFQREALCVYVCEGREGEGEKNLFIDYPKTL